MDEQQRIDLALAYHQRAGISLPNETVHAVIHVVVENQIADDELPVRRTAQRLMLDGLDRHDAIHAIAVVFKPSGTSLMPRQNTSIRNQLIRESLFRDQM